MAMIDFSGRRWLAHPDDCRLRLCSRRELDPAPVPCWSLQLTARSSDSILTVSVFPLALPRRDIQHLTLSVDDDWQGRHEFVDDNGEVQCVRVEVRQWCDVNHSMGSYWISDRFNLVLGSSDGDSIFFELESAVESEADYHHETVPQNSPILKAALPLTILGQLRLEAGLVSETLTQGREAEIGNK